MACLTLWPSGALCRHCVVAGVAQLCWPVLNRQQPPRCTAHIVTSALPQISTFKTDCSKTSVKPDKPLTSR